MKGLTLVELMVAIAMLGILAVTGGAVSAATRDATLQELQRERAAQLLEYEADCLSSGRAVDQAVVSALTTSLPRAQVVEVANGRTVTLTVRWRQPGSEAMASRSLTVFRKGAR